MAGGATAFAWPVDRLSDAAETLASMSGLRAKPASGSTSNRPGRGASKTDSVDGGIERLSRALEFEVEAVEIPYDRVARTLATAGPALVKLKAPDGDRVLVLVDAAGQHARLIRPDGRPCRVLLSTVAEWITRHLESPIASDVDRLLSDSGVPTARWPAARRALMATRLGPVAATRCWMLRPTPAASLWQHIRHARLTRRLIVFVLAYAGAAVASLGAWALIGGAALEGRFDPGTLLAWSFLLLSLVPLGLFAMWSQGVFMVGVSGILKMQLLAGALKLDPDKTRTQGVGQHFARVIDSSALEGLALAGGFYALTAFFDLSLAVLVMAWTGRALELAALVVCIAVVAGVGVLYFRARERWTAARLFLTHSLVERMVGHRTRLVQASASEGHDDEDAALSRYVDLSRRMDRAAIALSMLPRAWLLVGLAVLFPAFASGTSTPGGLAVGLGLALLASGALLKLSASLTTLVDAAVSWKQVAPLLEALRVAEPAGHVDVAGDAVSRMPQSRGGALIVAQDLVFRFPGRAGVVLDECGFRIAAGDRIHLTGSSGGGKSTLISLLSGLRAADSGLLLLQGLDRATLGLKAWRRRIAAAPQFHENHLFSDTLAFNLLMGRRWPPTADDLRWAEVVCRRLDLGDLIDRMPAGLFQPVGETGWQLSHGERSRVYMARALLQGADLVVLDESFAELDPASLQRCLPEAADLSKSLLVVAHV
jgi:ATP-binding cassette, subfamily B, bacterial